jgi:hypothetical protein
MNVERFRAVVDALHADFHATNPAPLLVELETSLESLAREPNDPAARLSVDQIKATLDERLAHSSTNSFSPAWREALVELGVDGLVGDRLRLKVEAISEHYAFDPAPVAREIDTIGVRVAEMGEGLDELHAGFELFKIPAEELAPGTFGIGFRIPRPEVDSELGELGMEFIRLKRLIGPFLEISTGTREAVRVQSISSSGYAALLVAAPTTAVLVAKVVEHLISSYEKVMKIRIAHRELQESDIPDETLEALSAHAQISMSRDIDLLIDELLSDAPELRPERANELRKELKDSLNGLANRIDRGYTIEVRAGSMPTGADRQLSQNEQESLKIAEVIRSKQDRLWLKNLSGKDVLGLPESPDEDGTSR